MKFIIFLVLDCLGLIESSRIMIVTSKPIMKLGSSLGIMPYQRTPWKVSYPFLFDSFNIVCLIL
jgi:hypothetical protein